MRTIKFRAWDKENKIFQPVCVDINGNACVFGYTGLEIKFDNIQQYTGLKDKNGKEIYEGDIIKHYMGDSLQTNPSVVSWNNNGGWSPWLENNGDCYTFVSNEEVIGNIFENPEIISK